MSLLLMVLAINAIIFGWLGAYIATQKNREPLEGGLLGVFFSIVGVLIEATLPSRVLD